MKRTLLLIVSLLFLLTGASAQSKKEKMLSGYSAKKEQMQRQYRDRKNAIFQEYLEKSWEIMNGSKPLEKPKEKDVPPAVVPKNTPPPSPEDKPVPFTNPEPEPAPEPKPSPVFPIKEVPETSPNTVSFVFYGTPCSVRMPRAVRMGSLSDIAKLWEEFSGSEYDNMLYDCLSIKKKLSLCDWAYMQMVESFATHAYGNNAEAIVLQGYILTVSGVRIFFAKDGRGALHILLSTDRDLYGAPYWTIGKEHCFLLDGCSDDSMSIMSKAFDGTLPLSLDLNANMKFALNDSPVRTLVPRGSQTLQANVSSNLNLIRFYNNYPESVRGGDFTTRWRLYANTPLSLESRNRLYPALYSAIDGKSEKERVELLLNFVQTAFEYEYDDKVWGRDRVFFADETLYYPYCDCEDRSILFSRLVRDLTGLGVVLLYYPGHLATAVCFNEQVTGDYLLIDGRKYVVCDPTYIGAPVGLTMPKMNNETAVVIRL